MSSLMYKTTYCVLCVPFLQSCILRDAGWSSSRMSRTNQLLTVTPRQVVFSVLGLLVTVRECVVNGLGIRGESTLKLAVWVDINSLLTVDSKITKFYLYVNNKSHYSSTQRLCGSKVEHLSSEQKVAGSIPVGVKLLFSAVHTILHVC